MMDSIWSQTCQIPERAPLEGDIKTEVAVIGAGMAGVLIASALQDAGARVVVLEADRIASGQTRNTTAKLTSQHGLIYRKLIDTFGEDKARQYAMANEAALDEYRRIIIDRDIDCDFKEQCAYVYGDDAEALRAEAECAAALGLPASLTEVTALPFPAAGAVRFERQAQFHPLKLLRAMAGRKGAQTQYGMWDRHRGEDRLRLPLPLHQLSGAVFCPDASGTLLCAGAGKRTAHGRNVDLCRGGDTSVFLPHMERPSPAGRRRAPLRREQRGRAIRRSPAESADMVPRKPGGGSLVGAGLRDGGRRSVYRRLCTEPPGLVCRHGISEMGHDDLDGVGHAPAGLDLRSG